MRIRIQHRTSYIYDEPATSIIQVLRLTPRNHEGQRVRHWRIDLDQDVQMLSGEDAFGNLTHSMSFSRRLDDLSVMVRGEVETHDTNGIVRGTLERFPPGLYLRETFLTQADTALRKFAHDRAGADGVLGQLHKLMAAIHSEMEFNTAPTDANTSAAKAFALKTGVCQDFSHVFIAAARSLDIPARYIGGYMLRNDGEIHQGAGHAWAEAYVPDIGWIAFDAANDLCPSETHVRVSMGLDYLGAAPVRGSHRGGSEERLEVSVTVDDPETAAPLNAGGIQSQEQG